MFIVFFVLLFTSVILLATNPKDTASRWAVFFMLLSCGGSASVLIVEAIPILQSKQIASNGLIMLIGHISILLSVLNQCTFAFGILMFAISYSGFFSKETEKKLALYLCIPPIFMLILRFFQSNVNFPVLLLWAGPFLIIACVLLILSLLKETDSKRKENKRQTVLIMVPTIIAVLIFNNVLKVFDPLTEYVRYLSIFIGFSFFLFLVFAFRNGALGVKLKFERHVLNSTRRVMQSGVNIINHTMKNEIEKINFLNYKIDKYLSSGKYEEAKKIVGDTFESTSHILAMVDRIKELTKEIELIPRKIDIVDCVDRSISLASTLAESKEIEINKFFSIKGQVIIDDIQIQEVIVNIIYNAIEAIGQGGVISIALTKKNHDIYIEIQDKGPGIPSHILNKIREPFFTTKRTGTNHGLGLSYCASVMEKHGGDMRIYSTFGEGTMVVLILPNSRILSVTKE